ncbi:amino acid adenylation domain-containing protein [Dactylosporangium sp. NPDC005572]|uniref:amino acid adenylation domain-containing protein n=1 Tax=Dactylosporangium sp. NPDC005572 TaxID=3156889 RepID=UPI0033A6B24D
MRLNNSIVEVIRRNVHERGADVTYEFLADSGTTGTTLSILELDRRARAVAVALLRTGTPGARVMLLFPPGEHFIVGFLATLYAGMVAVPVYPPDPMRLARTLPRLRAVTQNSQAEIVLSTGLVHQFTAVLVDQAPELARLPWLVVEDEMSDGADDWREPDLRQDSVALLQYTSGSTGTPRGVVVTHENLLANGLAIADNFGLVRGDVTVSWLPFYHDMGLLGGVLQPLLFGMNNILMSPLDFLRRPMRWLETISARGGTLSGGPNFAFDLCVSKSTAQERAALDLSSWRVAFCGAEPVRHQTLTRFTEAFAASGFDPSALLSCYGLAEATLFVAGSGRGRGPERLQLDRQALEKGRAELSPDGDHVVSSGRVAADHAVAVVDPETGEAVAPGTIGELWVSGPSVAAGYWCDDTATATTFAARLTGDQRAYLRTGDLGFVHDEQLYVTGRLKEMMVVRGRNLYATDLEETAVLASDRARPGCAAVFSVEADDGEQCVVFQEVTADTPADELPLVADAIAAALLDEHGVTMRDVVLLAPRSLAKTSSGKVQRLASRTAYRDGDVEGELYRRSAADPATRAEALTFGSRAELLALNAEQRIAAIEDSLSRAGRRAERAVTVADLDLDSVAAIELAFTIEEHLGVVADPSLLLRPVSLREVAATIDARLRAQPQETAAATPRSGDTELVPLSAGQQSLLFIRDLEGPDTQQNVSVAVRLAGPVDVEVLADAVRHVGARHPILTSSFGVDGSRRWHRLDPQRPFELAVVDLAGQPESALREQVDACALAPFDLERGDVARAGLFVGSGAPVLVVAQHHAITDFWSVVTFFDELATIYSGLSRGREPVLPAVVGYEEFVRWQQDYERSAQWQDDQRYWLDLLSGDAHAPTLPYQEQPGQGIAGHRVTVGPEVLGELERIAAGCGTTLFTVLLAAFEVLIGAHSGEDDFIVGVTTTGRPQARFRNTLGYFSNTVPVRVGLDAHASVADLIRSTGGQLRESLSHEHFPYSRLVELLRARGNVSAAINTAVVFERPHNGIGSDVTSVMFGGGTGSTSLKDLTLEPFPVTELATQFDITLHAVPAGDGILAHLLVRADRFDPALAEQLGQQYLDLLGQLAAGAEAPIGSLRLAGRTESLTRAAVPARTLPGVTSVHELFEGTAERIPDEVAIAAGDLELTYAEVERAANALAHELRQAGLRPEETVGLCLRRSPELIIAMLAVMKSGAAFVPLDPKLPQARLIDMVGDARCARILCHAETAELAGHLGATTRVDAPRPDADRPELVVSGGSLAYVIFTSGSTGRPKGVQIEHRSLVSYLLSFLDAIDVRPGDRVLQFAPLTFDPCLEEIFSAWIQGATLVLRDESVLDSPQRFWAWCEQQRLTLLDVPTAFFHVLVSALGDGVTVPPTLRAVLIGGEATHPDKLAQWFAADRGHVSLFNRWGTTETTVCSTVALLRPDSGRGARARDVSIGADMTDAVVHVLDAALRPVPDGIVGEAYIGGIGVGRGYASMPGRTAERFIPDPFATEPGRRLYATGDLVRRAGDGELRYVGRADQQVKVRGYRIELGEIDVVLRRHPHVVEAAVIALRGSGETELIAAVTGAGIDIAQVRDWMHRELPSYMVPTRLLTLEQIPLNPNGKVDAAALRELAHEVARADSSATMSPTEQRLAALWREVLEVSDAGPDDDFFSLGGHSLRAAGLNTSVRREFGVEPPLRMFFESVTLRAQATRIDELAAAAGDTGPDAAGAGETADAAAGVPAGTVEPRLSLGQRRLWFLEKFAPGSSAYVVPGVLRLYGALDQDALRAALDAVVERHPLLRTGFRDDDGRPVPVVREGLRCPFEVLDRSGSAPAQREPELARLAAGFTGRAFDLATPPLMRAALVRFAPDEHALLLAFHHIVSDGRSIQVIADDLAELYAGGADASGGPAHDYTRWAVHESARLESETGRRGLEFWASHLSGAPRALDLPFDRPRPALQTFSGARVPLKLSAADSALLRSLARDQQATVFMVLSACLASTLSRLSGQRRVVIGVPDANRPADGAYDDVVGFFVNTVPLCFDVPGGDTGRKLLTRTRTTTLEAMPWMWVPFSAIVEAVGHERDTSRSPVFQVILDVHSGALPAPALPGLRAETAPLYTGTAKTDLTFEIADDGGALSGWLEYNSDLFHPETARQIAWLFSETAQAIARRPDERVATPSATASLHHWPHDRAGQPTVDTFWAQFTRVTGTRADATAVEDGERAVTFAELYAQVEHVARVVRRRFDVAAGDVVAVSVEPSIEAVVALLAVQRAGGAYLPIDPAYPDERRAFMLADSGARGVLTRELVEAALSEPPTADPLPSADPGSAAYLMYTSGSTGRPKGVLVAHRSLANLTAAQGPCFGIGADSRMLQFASLSFDASVWEIFSTLAAGGTLCVVRRAHALVGEALADVLAERDITICLLPSSVIASLPDRALPRLATLVSGGEAVRGELVARWAPGRRFVNAYGPTECTVAVTAADCLPGDPASLGSVLPNGAAYILDADLRPVVTGAIGELYAGGAGLAVGYHRRPGLTAERFLPDPFAAVPGARMYRTGDLVRVRADGTVDYCGRADSQLKLRGFRIEPGEIESVLLAQPGVAEAVVRQADEVLVAYVESAEPEVTPQALERACAAVLPAHMVPVAYTVRSELPRLPGGKLDMSRLGRPHRDDYVNAAFAEPESPTERAVGRIWSEILEVGAVGAGDDFFALGGHSLLATVITSRVREELGRDVPLRTLFETPVLRDYAARCDAAASGPADGVAAYTGPGDAPLSVMQERLWVLEQLERDAGQRATSGRYHLAGAIRLAGRLDEAALQRAVDRLVDRHTTLRTVVIDEEGLPSQRVLPHVEIPLSRTVLRGADTRERIAEALDIVAREAATPMDLTAGPLLRIRLLTIDPEDTVLVLTLHHIVGDGWSMEILKRDLAVYYSHEAGGPAELSLPPLDVTYQDFARWQRHQLDSGALEDSISHWTERLEGLPNLVLPATRTGSADANPDGNRVRAGIPAPLRAQLERLAAASGGTLFMVLAAALQVTLGRRSGQRDFAIGAPIAGRGQREVQDLIGFFINSVVLRADLTGNPTFGELLDRVRSSTLDAYEHQDVPFETLVGRLAPERDLTTTPLFQVYLNLLNIPQHDAGLTGLEASPFSTPDLGAKFDLTFYVEPGDELTLDLVYAADRFDAASMRELLAQWIRVLEQAAEDSGRPIDELRLDTPLARRQLPDLTATLDATWMGSVVERFEDWAEREPQRMALMEPGQDLSYGDLAWATAALSGILTQHGVAKGDVVAIYGARGASLVWAILSVLRTGASFAIVDPSYPAGRIADCLEVAQPSAFLQLAAAGAVPLPVETALQAFPLRCRFELPSRLDDARHLVPAGMQRTAPVAVTADDCAYIAFTSGSTGKPKGIRGRHGSLTHFVPWMVETFGLRDTDRYSMLSGISHDPLHREVFTPLCTGATICVPAQADIETPGRLAQWFRTAQVSVGHLTPPMARLFNQLTIAPGTLPLLERVFFLGDALTSRDVRAIARMAGSSTCVNLYGSTESQRAVGYFVVPAADSTAEEDPGVTYPLGRGMRDVQLLVLTEAGNLAGVGEAGEIVIRSPHIALGYAGDERLTAAKFVRNPFTGDAADRMYRTGDIGRYAIDGVVVPLGRADNQVKIRGYRVETDEVQHVVCAAPGVRDALVVAREDAGGETVLAAYVIPDAGTAKLIGNDVKAFVRSRLPEYMVPASVVALDAFPLTPNRKIDRAALPDLSTQAAAQDDSPEAALTPTEELVAGVWQDVLGAPRVSPEDNFFNLGGHSLMATQVVSRIRRVFDCEIALRTLFELQTVRQLAAHIDGMARGAAPAEPVVALPRTGPLPSSYGQERLWILDQLEGDTGAYNSATVVRLRGPLDTDALAATLDELVARHEVLRTRLVMRDGVVSQVVEDIAAVTMPLAHVDLGGEPDETVERRWQQCVQDAAGKRFDLDRAPLEQATLIRIRDEDHVFVLTVHHVVADGWGLQVLVRDFAALYQARCLNTASPLPPLDVQYADWSAWQRARVEQGDYQSQLDFWCATLADPAPLLEFPAQRPRPATMSSQGLTIRRVIGSDLVNDVRRIGRAHNATLFMTLLAAFNTQLHRYSGARDITVATPVSTRSVETENIVGFFVNTIVFRNQLSGDEPFTALLDRVRATTLSAYANQDVPFDRVVDALQPSRDLSRSPLFQVMFVLHNAPYSEIDLGDLKLERLHAPAGTAKFDLSFDLAEEKNGLHATLELNADLFDAETGEQLLDHFEALLRSIAEAPQHPLNALELRPAEELRAQAALCAGPAAFTPPSTAEALQRWAERTPDAPAVVDGARVWSYRELRDVVAGLADRLSALVTGAEPAVVVSARRSAEHIAVALACGEIGATYVPVSPGLPDQRVTAMLDRLGDAVVATDVGAADRFDALAGDRPRLRLDEPVTGERTLGLHRYDPRHRAYVIFTSGTTGEPKGVEIEQGGLLNHLELMAQDLDLAAGDVIAQTASQSFDISVWQMLVAVMRGATVVVSDDDTSRDAAALTALVRDRGVTVLQLVPAMIRTLLDRAAGTDRADTAGLGSLRYLIATGEALPPDLCADWLRRFPGIPMVNAYGPAECSDDTHLALLTSPPPTDRAVTIGHPVAGVTSYVVNEDGWAQPLGVPGELAIGGLVVGRGYLGDPRVTADRFVPDPYATEPGARLYRTGDRARLLRDGRLEFLGRLDEQLKVRGFRIEAGEVETALRAVPGVTEAAVVVRGGDDEPSLTACVAGTERDPAAIAAALAARLPRYMIPGGYVFVDDLPRTPNGKVDRSALLADDLVVERVRRHYEDLTGPVERLVAAAFETLLGATPVGALDDFFELGGHSLLATRLVSELSTQTDVELPLRAVFERSTVRGIAGALQERQLESLSDEERLEFEELLGQLTDDEARALLTPEPESEA